MQGTRRTIPSQDRWSAQARPGGFGQAGPGRQHRRCPPLPSSDTQPVGERAGCPCAHETVSSSDALKGGLQRRRDASIGRVTSLNGTRSLLFAPGGEERKLVKAFAAGADAVIADLEDAVAPAAKAEARDLVVRVLAEAQTPSTRLVRVNGTETVYFPEDLAAVTELEVEGIVLPKATPDAVAALGSKGPPVIALVETAQGLRLAYETAAEPRVVALMLGAVDLGSELGLQPRSDGIEILYARSKLVVDSAAAGIRPPFDVVHLEVHDVDGLESEALLARSLGFGGKTCIHPAQVAIVNEVFTPSVEQVERAKRVLAAYERGLSEGRGVVTLEGKMVDLPVVEHARRILAAAESELD
jgi:citrate lyase beta subunit